MFGLSIKIRQCRTPQDHPSLTLPLSLPNLSGAIPQFSTNASLMLRVNKDDGILYKGPQNPGSPEHGLLTWLAHAL